jgi:hypothetical protein
MFSAISKSTSRFVLSWRLLLAPLSSHESSPESWTLATLPSLQAETPGLRREFPSSGGAGASHLSSWPCTISLSLHVTSSSPSQDVLPPTIPAGRVSLFLGCGVRSQRSSVLSILVSFIAPTTSGRKLIRTLGLLICRLVRYRREFHRLISARNTTKSRFLRLFLMAILFITLFLPYTLYILYVLASTVEDFYDWDFIHGPNWNVIVKVPTQGGVRFDIWAEIATGYLLFLLFGTGTDAHNTYKRMLCAASERSFLVSTSSTRVAPRHPPVLPSAKTSLRAVRAKPRHSFQRAALSLKLFPEAPAAIRSVSERRTQIALDTSPISQQMSRSFRGTYPFPTSLAPKATSSAVC